MATKRDNSINIDLEFNVDVFTTGSAIDLINGIIECLLYQRNQIPLVFPTFKTIISSWKENDDDDNEDYVNYQNFMIDKQRNLARSTLNAINNVKMALKEELQRSNILSVRLLFGSTIATPRECFMIKLPKISRSHSSENHKISVEGNLKKFLMSLVTSEKLYNVFSSNLPTTNMFLDLHIEGAYNYDSDHFCQKDFDDLPQKCSCITINIQCENNDVILNCCHELSVFEDISKMNILNENTNEVEEKKSFTDGTWLESNYYVRGFKDVPVKGNHLWKSGQR